MQETRTLHILGAGNGIGYWFTEHIFSRANEINRIYAYDVEPRALENLKSLQKKKGGEKIIPVNSSTEQGEAVFSEGDVLVFATPPAALQDAIDHIRPHLKRDSLIVTFQSVQSTALEQLSSLCRPSNGCTLLGCHPLFGPTQPPPSIFPNFSLAVLVNYRDDETNHIWFRALIRGLKISTAELNATAHDQLMSFLQAATHFTLLGLVGAAKKLEIDATASLEVKTTVYNLTFAALSRVMNQSADTTFGIQETTMACDARRAVRETLETLDGIFLLGQPNVEDRNSKARFSEWLDDHKSTYKENLQEGRAISDVFLDGLGRFETLLDRFKSTQEPFVCLINNSLEVVKIKEIKHKHVVYEVIGHRGTSTPVERARYAIDFENKIATENYKREGIVFVDPQMREKRTAPKHGIKLLTKGDLDDFWRNRLWLVRVERKYHSNSQVEHSFFEEKVPSLMLGLRQCSVLEDEKAATGSWRYKVSILVDPRFDLGRLKDLDLLVDSQLHGVEAGRR